MQRRVCSIVDIVHATCGTCMYYGAYATSHQAASAYRPRLTHPDTDERSSLVISGNLAKSSQATYAHNLLQKCQAPMTHLQRRGKTREPVWHIELQVSTPPQFTEANNSGHLGLFEDCWGSGHHLPATRSPSRTDWFHARSRDEPPICSNTPLPPPPAPSRPEGGQRTHLLRRGTIYVSTNELATTAASL